ncbi:MAG TPA: tRNA glutamyl-Q(34) synthetase GluQRS, partial [Woeseiaceae bacterium]|nr:tRNA glutamyl-Q(34) synthetase GluQRS [Woeseiaceae bacterium]
ARRILEALETYGFEWDGSVGYQSRNAGVHREAISALLHRGAAYRCACSRRDLLGLPRGPLGPIYPGTCRAGSTAHKAAVRVRTHDDAVSFDDALQGPRSQRLESESGDFVICRRDGLIAYHLAVVVDDANDRVSEVVRGVDLLDSTPRQIHLQRLLGLPTPRYMHIPVAENAAGQKLSKRTGAAGLDLQRPRPTLVAALRALQQPLTGDIANAPLGAIWEWAITHWDPAPLHGRCRIPPPPGSLAGTENGLS